MDARNWLGEPRLLISRAALLHNARLLRRQLATPDVKICAMVKADGYGHGASIVADALTNITDGPDSKPACEQLAAATIEEAVALPSHITAPITVLRQIENVFLGRQRNAIEQAIIRRFTLTIATAAAADDVARIALASGRQASLQIMVDTGLSRCGTPVDSLADLLHRIDSLPSLRVTSLATHFANSEVKNDPYTIDQLRRFLRATDEYVESKQGRVTRHAANSGGIFFTSRAHLDMVRPGISLYGIDPTGKPNIDRALKPVMRWTAPLVAVNDVKAGTSVGYNQSFIAPRDMRVGLVPVGYADGYLRSLSNKGVMIVGDGSRCPVVGRVSMDLTTIDLTHAPHAHIGEPVTILDNNPLSAASVYELSRLADTIPYELFTRIGPRVKRVAIDPTDSDLPTAEEIDDEDDSRSMNI